MFSSEQNMFREALALVGQDIEVTLRSTGKRLTGKVTNAMFDSLIVEAAGKNAVVRFGDVLYLTVGR